jgi:hypothetical protein
MAANASIELNGELEKLLKTWKDHSEALLLGNEDTVEYSVALSSVATSLAKTLGTEADLTNFVHTNKNLVAQFLNGNLELFDNI